MTKPTFRLWQPLIVMVLLFTFSLIFVSQMAESQLRQQQRDRLQLLAQLGAGISHQLARPGMSKGVLSHLMEGRQVRMQLVNDSGLVLADSRPDAGGTVAITELPEIRQALATGNGQAIREDPSLGKVFHLAISLPSSEGAVLVRVSEPLKVHRGQTMTLRFWTLFTWVLGLLAILSIWRWLNGTLESGRRDAAASQEIQVVARTRDLAMLQRLGSLMSACTSVTAACKVMEPIAEQLLPGARGCIALIRSSRGLEMVTHWGGNWPGPGEFGSEECWALLKGNPHLSCDEGIEIHCEHQTQPGSQLCIPLLAQGEALGVLSLMFTDEVQMLAGKAVAESMAEQVGLALANIRLRNNLKDQAIRDPLSGLFNRRHMMEFLEAQLALSERRQEPLSMLMMDIDHFKKFNDTFGHDSGDFVIQRVAKELTELVRRSDLVCRYGGEELAVICPDTDVSGALDLGNKLISAVAALELSHNGQELGRVTLSAGVSCTEGKQVSMERLMKVADEALYSAKQKGRNRVEVAEGLLPQVLASLNFPVQTTEPG